MRRTLLAALLLASACGVTPPPEGYLATPEVLTRSVAAPPAAVTTAAVAVLAEYGLPVASRDPDAGLVQSGEMTVQGSWDGAAVRDRIYCGQLWDSGVEIALSNPVTFTVGILAQPDGAGSTVRLNLTGRAEHSGFGQSPRTYACQPTAAFAQEVLDRIAARAAQG